MTIGSNSKTKKNVVEAEPATEQEQPKQTLPQTELAQYSHEDYAKRVEAQEKEAQEVKEKRTRAVLVYVHRTMSRFLYEEDLYKVIEAVKEWSSDTNYTPTATNRFKENVGAADNLGCRMKKVICLRVHRCPFPLSRMLISPFTDAHLYVYRCRAVKLPQACGSSAARQR